MIKYVRGQRLWVRFPSPKRLWVRSLKFWLTCLIDSCKYVTYNFDGEFSTDNSKSADDNFNNIRWHFGYPEPRLRQTLTSLDDAPSFNLSSVLCALDDMDVKVPIGRRYYGSIDSWKETFLVVGKETLKTLHSTALESNRSCFLQDRPDRGVVWILFVQRIFETSKTVPAVLSTQRKVEILPAYRTVHGCWISTRQQHQWWNHPLCPRVRQLLLAGDYCW